MRFFLAGIMQGSHAGATLHEQDYRPRIKGLLEKYFPGAEVYDPLADHEGSLDYDDEEGRRVFLQHARKCREVDVVLAFVPEASMGTAVEMWEAYRHGRVVIAVSPLAHNWTVKFCSHQMYVDMAAFREALISGRLAKRIEAIRKTADRCPIDGKPPPELDRN